MSCWREQHVLRMPATTIGINTKDEWNAFYSKIKEETDWGAGSFAPALCSYAENGPMINFPDLLSNNPMKELYLCDIDDIIRKISRTAKTWR